VLTAEATIHRSWHIGVIGVLEALVKRSAEVTSVITMKVRLANELALTITLNGPSSPSGSKE
jgi:hypothetical protein